MILSLKDININEEELDRILKQHQDIPREFHITETVLEPYSKTEKNGHLGEHLRLIVTVVDEHTEQILKLQFFVKGLPKDDQNLNDLENSDTLSADSDDTNNFDIVSDDNGLGCFNNIDVNFKSDKANYSDYIFDDAEVNLSKFDFTEANIEISTMDEKNIKIKNNNAKRSKKYSLSEEIGVIINDLNNNDVKSNTNLSENKEVTSDSSNNNDITTKTTKSKTNLQITVSQQLKEMEGFKKEMIVYTKNIASCPKFYYNSGDYIILEDLQEQCYKGLHSQSQFDMAHCKLFLKRLAEFHASATSKIDRKIELKEGLFLLDDSVSGIFFKSSYEFLLQFLAIYESPEFVANNLKKIQKLWNNIGILSQYQGDSVENVVCHGDVWYSNILFKYDQSNKPNKNKSVDFDQSNKPIGVNVSNPTVDFNPTNKNKPNDSDQVVESNPIDCILIDFQLIKRAPPAHDVMMFLAINLPIKFRNENLDELLHYYFDHLQVYLEKYNCEVSEKLSNWDYFYQSCKFHLKIAKILTASTQRPLMFTSSEVNEKIYESVENHLECWYGDRSKFLLEPYLTDKTYRELVNEGFQEIIQLLNEDDSEEV